MGTECAAPQQGAPKSCPSSDLLPHSPVPRIKWRKLDGSQSSKWIGSEPLLQIQDVGFEDEGTYECEAENIKGRDTYQGRIIIQGNTFKHTLFQSKPTCPRQRTEPLGVKAPALILPSTSPDFAKP